MKAVVISVIIFLVLLLAIFGNRLFLSQTAESLSSLAESLSGTPDRQAILAELDSVWQRRRPILALTVPRAELERREELLIGLQETAFTGDEVRFQLFAALLANASGDLACFG